MLGGRGLKTVCAFSKCEKRGLLNGQHRFHINGRLEEGQITCKTIQSISFSLQFFKIDAVQITQLHRNGFVRSLRRGSLACI